MIFGRRGSKNDQPEDGQPDVASLPEELEDYRLSIYNLPADVKMRYHIRRPCDTCFYRIENIALTDMIGCWDRRPACAIAKRGGDTSIPMFALDTVPDGTCGMYRPLMRCQDCRYHEEGKTLIDGSEVSICRRDHGIREPMDCRCRCKDFEPKEV